MLKRILTTLVLLGSVLAAPAEANDGKDGFTKKRGVDFASEDLSGFATGKIVDWSDGRSHVHFKFQVDTLDGTTASAPEWGIEVYDTACAMRRSYPIYTGRAVDDPTYGVRIQDFIRPYLLARAGRGSVLLVHDGPTLTHHAVDMGYSGRHELACVDLFR